METKGAPKLVVVNKKEINYIAIKGSLHATDCSVFGLSEEEVKVLGKKYEPVINGFSISMNVLIGLNTLSQNGYHVISSTGETEITWTLQKEF